MMCLGAREERLDVDGGDFGGRPAEEGVQVVVRGLDAIVSVQVFRHDRAPSASAGVSASSITRRRATSRADRDLMVLAGSPNAAAISANVRPSSKRSESRARSSGSSLAIATARRSASSAASRASPGRVESKPAEWTRSRSVDRSRRLLRRTALIAAFTVDRLSQAANRSGWRTASGDSRKCRKTDCRTSSPSQHEPLPTPHQGREGAPVPTLEPIHEFHVGRFHHHVRLWSLSRRVTRSDVSHNQ